MQESRFPLYEAVHVYLHRCIPPPERQKRYGPRQRGLNLLIGQCQCCANHGCNLCVVSACMCCPVNGISHRMRLTSDGVKFSDNSNVRSVLFHPLSANPCACKSPMYTESKATQKSRYVCGCSLLIKPWLRMTLNILRKGYDSSLCSSIV